MRYYLAAAYERRAELAGYRDRLTAVVEGAEVTSRWLIVANGGLDVAFTPEVMAAQTEAVWKFGQADLEDLAVADAIVSFTGEGVRGGRHVEHGIAISYVDNGPWLNMGERAVFRLIVVGPREHIFHCHPATEVYADFEAFLAHEVAGD